MHSLTFENLPELVGLLIKKVERIEDLYISHNESPKSLPKYVDINGAAIITSKTPNALRIQISLGNLKAIKKGSRNYFDRAYLEEWIAGEKSCNTVTT